MARISLFMGKMAYLQAILDLYYEPQRKRYLSETWREAGMPAKVIWISTAAFSQLSGSDLIAGCVAQLQWTDLHTNSHLQVNSSTRGRVNGQKPVRVWQTA